MTEIIELPLESVKFREDLYPRIERSASTVQKYAEDLSVLPAIEVNQHGELIDGWHRWTAHKKVGVETVRARTTPTASDAEFLELAIERNAAHGLQLSQEDKRSMARQIYHATDDRERDGKKAHLARILSVSERTVRDWLSRIDKDAKDARNRRVFDLWMSCHTQEEISELVGCTRDEVRGVKNIKFGESGNLAEFPKDSQANATHATAFQVPVYNIWKEQKPPPGLTHFGQTYVRWLDNLLYLYTNPFDIVVDPFAGSGSTIDLCKKRFRRYWVADRKPVVERENEIRQWDITEGLPALPQWKDVRLVYLDPPYWWQAKEKYSKDETDLGNMPLEVFNKTLAATINGFASKLKNGEPSYIALIIQPTQWNAPDRQYTDHVADMLRMVKLPIDMRFSCPYESQQYTPQMVEWAKDNKRCLVLSRELIVWRVG